MSNKSHQGLPIPASCCAPTRTRLAHLDASRVASGNRRRVKAGSLADMIHLEGRFQMGSERVEAFPMDGEGPVRQVILTEFYISKCAVTNMQFAEFTRSTGYRTEAERFGWSFVFHNHVREALRSIKVPGTPWWVRVDGADWAHPEGPDSSISGRLDRPVVHVSWADAQAWLRVGRI